MVGFAGPATRLGAVDLAFAFVVLAFFFLATFLTRRFAVLGDFGSLVAIGFTPSFDVRLVLLSATLSRYY